MTGLDWLIIAFALLMGVWGYRQGLIVGALSLAGFAVGAFMGSRIGPELLPDGAESPYSPAVSLAGALLVGGLVAVSLETVAVRARRKVLGPAGRRRAVGLVEGTGGALLLVALALGLAWLFGAVALNTPGAKDLRKAVQRSEILRALNSTFPPTGDFLNFLNRIDPRVAINGPQAAVGPPDPSLTQDPEVRAAEGAVVRVTGTACGLGVEGSGWLARPGLVVTNAHVVAGEEDTVVSTSQNSTEHDAIPVHFDTVNDLALLEVDGLGGNALQLAQDPSSGTTGAVLGFPENGPYRVAPARLGATTGVISQDAYGRGPVTRQLTALRGEVRSGNSGGPMVDASGRVLTTVFASTTKGKPGGYGIPNSVVRDALSASTGAVDTGPCTR